MQAPPAQQENSAPQAASSSNPFMQAPGQGESSQGSSTFMDGISAFNRQFERLALGSMQLMSNFLPESVNQSVERVRKLGYGGLVVGQNEADLAAKRSPIASGVGTVAGAIGAGTAYGAMGTTLGGAALGAASPAASAALGEASAAHPILTGAASGTASGAGIGALDEADSGTQRMEKTALGGAAGAVLGAALPVGRSIKHWVTDSPGQSSISSKLFTPDKAALKDVAATVGSEVGNNPAAIQQAVQSGKSLGVNVTPGEAFPESQGVVERVLKPSDQMKNEIIRPQYTEKVAQTKDAIVNTISKMAPEDAKQQVDGLFQSLNKQYITPNGAVSTEAAEAGVPDIVKNTPVLAQKYQELLKAQSDKIKGLPTNSVSFMDQMRKSIDDDLYNNKNYLNPDRPLSIDDRAALQEARVKLQSTLNQSPEYVAAMDIARKANIQSTYKKLIESQSFKAGRGNDLGLDEYRAALFKTKEKQDKFISDVITTGGDPEQAKSVIDLTDKLAKSPLKNILNVASKGDPDYQRLYGKDVGIVQSAVNKVMNARYYNSLLNLTMDPKWSDKVAEVLAQKGTTKKLNKFVQLIKDVSDTGAVQTGAVGATSSGFGNQLVGE